MEIQFEESEQWKLFKIMKEKYSIDIIKEQFYLTESIVAKIYLYWIIREKNEKEAVLFYDLIVSLYGDTKIEFLPLVIFIILRK